MYLGIWLEQLDKIQDEHLQRVSQHLQVKLFEPPRARLSSCLILIRLAIDLTLKMSEFCILRSVRERIVKSW